EIAAIVRGVNRGRRGMKCTGRSISACLPERWPTRFVLSPDSYRYDRRMVPRIICRKGRYLFQFKTITIAILSFRYLGRDGNISCCHMLSALPSARWAQRPRSCPPVVECATSLVTESSVVAPPIVVVDVDRISRRRRTDMYDVRKPA